MNPSKKTAALLLCVFFALAMLFSSALIIHEAGHDCAGEDCPICRAVVYHACVIPDATACCAQGIEFTLAGDHRWPDDYPEHRHHRHRPARNLHGGRHALPEPGGFGDGAPTALRRFLILRALPFHNQHSYFALYPDGIRRFFAV